MILTRYLLKLDLQVVKKFNLHTLMYSLKQLIYITKTEIDFVAGNIS